MSEMETSGNKRSHDGESKQRSSTPASVGEIADASDEKSDKAPLMNGASTDAHAAQTEGATENGSSSPPPNGDGDDSLASASVAAATNKNNDELPQASSASHPTPSFTATSQQQPPFSAALLSQAVTTSNSPLSLTAEEVNFLIYRYLQESGFTHSAFSFAHESLVGRSRPRNSADIPPGALVLFLQKGLQYVGMEESLMREMTGRGAASGGGADGEDAVMGENEDGLQLRPNKKSKGTSSASPNGADDNDDVKMGPDFSLLCPRALNTLKQKEPPIKLRVPPASAAAVIKAKMEMEEKLSRERKRRMALEKEKMKSGNGVFYEEENHGDEEEMTEQEYLRLERQQRKGAKGGQKKVGAAAKGMSKEEEEMMRGAAYEGGMSSATPKKRKKKKKAAAAAMEEEEQQSVGAKAGKGSKSSSAMDVDETDARQRQQHSLQQQQFEQAQRMQQEALRAHQQRQQDMLNSNRGGAGDGPPQSIVDPAQDAADVARQRAEIQAVLAQRQHVAVTQGGEGGGGTAQQQQQPPSQQKDSRANAIAALLSAAAGGNASAEEALSRMNVSGSEVISSASMNGKSEGVHPMPGDKRGGGVDQEAANSAIEEEDRLKSIHPNEVVELSQHTSEVFMCAWNPVFTNLIATGSGDASARIWAINPPNASAGCQQSILLPHGVNSTDKKNKDVTTLEWSSSGELLATGSYDGVARVWSRNGELKQTLKGHRGPIFSLKWNKSGNFLLSGSYDKSTIVWDVAGDVGFVKQQFSYHFAPALDVDWKDDLTFASCSTDKTVQICCVGLARPLKTYTGHADEVNAVKWDPSGTLLASCSDDCTAKVWDFNSPDNGPKWDFKSHQQEIYTVKWSPTGAGSKNPNKPLMLATASFDGSVRLWNVVDGTCSRILSRHRESVYSVSFSPSGDYLASGSLAGQLYIWNVRDGSIIKSFKGKGDIFEVAWNAEESRVAACFSCNVVCVIDFKRP